MSDYLEGEDRNGEATPMFHGKRGEDVKSPSHSRHEEEPQGRAVSIPTRATWRQYMGRLEREDRLPDAAYIREWARRAAEWFETRVQGGEKRAEQEQLERVGANLQDVRRGQNRSLEEVATSIRLDPAMLCFLESGWATKDEFLEVIDQWASALGQDVAEYTRRMPMEGD